MGEGAEQEELNLATTDLDKISLKFFYGKIIFCLTQYNKGFNPEGECVQVLLLPFLVQGRHVKDKGGLRLREECREQ